MKAFLAGCALMTIIGVAAWVALGSIDMSASSVYVSERGSVRL
ncbi:hypothetical protein [Lutibaculum baratangense]|uniref:Uncharacterized protein n=1 Tax=Lutibaculum baratangense AMV1 TaxID=631454 RepID=V4T8H6_9HYPH|nr:hypothetical protein [Lutibaculum baratangense]ESR22868.1 hypothetical protein N177_4005 [Lutibaculum baratangense AMV1]